MITVRIPADQTDLDHAITIADWLDENVSRTTITPQSDHPKWWRAGEGWGFYWASGQWDRQDCWFIEFDDEKMATLFLLRWS